MATIAIIGSGISGMGAAALLHEKHDIVVYEKSATPGGHTRTLNIDYDGRKIAVDTGFIVFNHRNYPQLTALFKHHQVPTRKSNMTFGITVDDGKLEWGAENLNALFGQRGNICNLKFWRFLLDILRFNSGAVGAIAKNPGKTLGELISLMGLGDWFLKYYILPMGGAIWSCPLDVLVNFPADFFVRFFQSHGLLTVTQQPEWYTVTGGSAEYMKRLISPFESLIRTSCAVTKVTRGENSVFVTDSKGQVSEYDHVVFSCHADEALESLQDASPDEIRILGKFRYQSNSAVLHRDVSVMPKQRRCWSSWVYHPGTGNDISVTYWMNQLQGIDDKYPIFVTLNPARPIDPQYVFDEHMFMHPIYTQETFAAQRELPDIQGKRNTWFCGAYHRNGFHEDGLQSAVNVAKMFSVNQPW
jgi:predicted NAD/FAD-binding protein